MCACDVGFTCAKCAGTPFDERYYDNEPPPVTEEAFAELSAEPRLYAPQMFGEDG